MIYQNAEDVELVINATKESQTGLFSNERLLLIKAGIISYFSKIPKNYIENANSIDLAGELPKFSIAASDIEATELQDSSLSLLFKKSKLINKKSIEDLVKVDKSLVNSDKIQKLLKSNKDDSYEKWTFKCQNKTLLEQFYKLINLFRGKNSKFRPNIANAIQTFQESKKGTRQMSMIPTSTHKKFEAETNLIKQRISQIPSSSENNILKNIDLLSQIQKSFPQKKIISSNKKNVENQNKRLSYALSRFSTTNMPKMDIIDQKIEEDKNSQIEFKLVMSKDIDQKPNIQNKAQAKKQNCQQIVQLIQKQPIIEIKKEDTHENIKLIENKNLIIQDKKIKFEQNVKNHNQKIKKIDQINKQSRIKQCSKDLWQKLKYQLQYYSPQELEKRYNIDFNLLKEDNFLNNIQTNQIFLNFNDSSNFEQNQMNKIDIKSEKTISQNMPNSWSLVGLLDSESKILQAENQFEIAFQKQKNDIIGHVKNQLLQFSLQQQQIKGSFAYQISPFSFKSSDFIIIKNDFLLQANGKLQFFLIYMNLQRILKLLSRSFDKKIQFYCSWACYIKYINLECLIHQHYINCIPIQSVKSLQIYCQTVQIKQFCQNFPSYQILVEKIDDQTYKFYLRKIDKPSNINHDILVQYLHKLSFNYSQDIEEYMKTSDYNNLLVKSMNAIRLQIKDQKYLEQKDIIKILNSVDTKIQVEIICRLLNCVYRNQLTLNFEFSGIQLNDQSFYIGQGLRLIQKNRRIKNLQREKQIIKLISKYLRKANSITNTSYYTKLYLLLAENISNINLRLNFLKKIETNLPFHNIQRISVSYKIIICLYQSNQIQQSNLKLIELKQSLTSFFKDIPITLQLSLFQIKILLMPKAEKEIDQILKEFISIQQKISQNQYLSQNKKQKQLLSLELQRINLYYILADFQTSYKKINSLLIEKKEQIFNSKNNFAFQSIVLLINSWLQIPQSNTENSIRVQNLIQEELSWNHSINRWQNSIYLLYLIDRIIKKCRNSKMICKLQKSDIYKKIRQQHEVKIQAYYIELKNFSKNEFDQSQA